MNRILLSVLVGAGMTAWLAAGSKGDDFQARKATGELTIAVRLLSEQEVKQRFVSDLHETHNVVEVLIEPSSGATVELERGQFGLKAKGAVLAVEAESPATAAAALQRAAAAQRNVTLYPSGEVGYQSGDPYPGYGPDYGPAYDPRDPRRRGRGGLYTRVGVGVGISKGGPGSGDRDREVMEIELTDKGLPEGPIDAPVTGFLYFPILDEKAEAFLLEFEGASEKVQLELTR